jgi:hypothetical protein
VYSDDLMKSFGPKLFDFLDGRCIRDGKTGMIQHIKFGVGCTKEVDACNSLELS